MPKLKSSWVDLPDINVLLALIFDGHQHHPSARDWFEDIPAAGAALCRITQMGLLRLLTNPKVMGDSVLSQKEAWSVYDLLCSDDRWVFQSEGETLEPIWRKFTQSTQKGSVGWTDGYLTAFAHAHNLRLVTFDQGFKHFKKLNYTILPS